MGVGCRLRLAPRCRLTKVKSRIKSSWFSQRRFSISSRCIAATVALPTPGVKLGSPHRLLKTARYDDPLTRTGPVDR